MFQKTEPNYYELQCFFILRKILSSIHMYIYLHTQWGKKVISQSKVLSLKIIGEVCNFYHKYSIWETMRDESKWGEKIQNITLSDGHL